MDVRWGLWELYWKPLWKQDISDRRELEKLLKNETLKA